MFIKIGHIQLCDLVITAIKHDPLSINISINDSSSGNEYTGIIAFTLEETEEIERALKGEEEKWEKHISYHKRWRG